MTIIAAWSTRKSAVDIVQARVDAGDYTLANDGNVVWLHPNSNKEHVDGSVFAYSEADAIELYATTVAQFIGYDWAFE